VPLGPRTARAIDLAVGERIEGPIFQAGAGPAVNSAPLTAASSAGSPAPEPEPLPRATLGTVRPILPGHETKDS
jgi:hypothetical protein